MIDNILFKYMDRLSVQQVAQNQPGPVITISRECGCFAGEIAEKLAQRLSEENQKAKKESWNWISKEIISEAATKLQTNKGQVERFLNGESYNFLVDIMASFSKPYASDDNLKRTIKKVVKTYAEQGNVIIVGRAGFLIAQDITWALHIKLIASNCWRTESFAKKHNINEVEAKKQIQENDKKRDNFIKSFHENANENSLFHAIFNCEKLTADEIVDQIMLMAKEKKLV